MNVATNFMYDTFKPLPKEQVNKIHTYFNRKTLACMHAYLDADI